MFEALELVIELSFWHEFSSRKLEAGLSEEIVNLISFYEIGSLQVRLNSDSFLLKSPSNTIDVPTKFINYNTKEPFTKHSECTRRQEN